MRLLQVLFFILLDPKQLTVLEFTLMKTTAPSIGQISFSYTKYGKKKITVTFNFNQNGSLSLIRTNKLRDLVNKYKHMFKCHYLERLQ